MLNIGKLKRIAHEQQKSSWYESFTGLYDTQGHVVAGRWLRERSFFPKISKHTNYYEGKSGHPFSWLEVFTLRFPNFKNTCSVCGEKTKWQATHYSTVCGRSCGALACEPKRKATNMEKYGVPNAGQADIVKRKRVRTFVKRFGVTNPFKSSDLKDRIKTTMLERHGVDNASKSKKIKRKKQATSLENFGTTHWTKNSDMLDQKHTPFNRESIAKGRATSLDRHGYENAFDNPKVQDRIAKTNLKRYGVENPFDSDEIQRKAKNSVYLKYGVTNVFQSQEIQEQIRKTCLDIYGVEHPSTLAEYSYRRKTVRDKFGIKHTVQGYEDQAVLVFSKMKNVTDIVTASKRLPKYRYVDKEGKEHRYYPDMAVRTQTSTNIVEVKSLYTLTRNLGTNLLKFRAAVKACKNKGHTFWVVMFHNKQLYRAQNPTRVLDLVRADFPIPAEYRLQW